MVSIPFPLSTAPGQNPQESAGRLINCFAEPLGKTAIAGARWTRSPGYTTFGTSARTGCRGIIQIGGTLYAAFNGQLEKWTSSGGASTNVGALTGTKKVFFFRNNKTPTPDQFIVDPQNTAAFTFTSSSVSSYPDVDLPAVNAGCAYDGYGVFTTGAGQIWATDLNSTAVNALSFAKAESNPDGLLRPIPWATRLLAFGTRTIEVWTNAGTSPFPLERVAIIPRGLRGRYAVAGHEDGFQRALIFVGDDNAVYSLDGYTPTKVSPPDLDRLIQSITDDDDLEACCYVANGHGFWELSSSSWTWVYHTNTGNWHERRKYLGLRSRATTTHNGFGKWLCGDTESGNILEITPDSYDEVGDPLRMRIETGPVSQFPYRTKVARTDFLCTMGAGDITGEDPTATNPQCDVSWSNDGGVSWGNPLSREIGRQALADRQVTYRRIGLTGVQGRRYRLDFSAPVPFSWLGGDMSQELRR